MTRANRYNVPPSYKLVYNPHSLSYRLFAPT